MRPRDKSHIWKTSGWNPTLVKINKDPVFPHLFNMTLNVSARAKRQETENNLKWKGKLNPANTMILYVENPTRLIEKLKYSGRRRCQAVPSFQNRSQCSPNRLQQGFVSKVRMLTAAEEGDPTWLPRETRDSPKVHTQQRTKAEGTEFGTSSTATCRQPFNTQIFNQDKTGW